MDALLLKINQYILNPILGFLFILAFAYFLWGVFQYFLYSDSEDARVTGRRHMLYGLIGIFIMVGFWGIIQVIASTLNVPVTKP